MSWVQAWRTFHRRRIAVPVGDEDLVLDVGSGDKPSWRADVLLDRYTGAEHAAQRSGRKRAAVRRPLFDADAAAMPFRDKSFDYVICSNVLEHVTDPVAVAAEMSRVGRAGYIEVPEAASAKIVDFPSHLWWCRLVDEPEGPTLVFTAKTAPHFDPEIADYIERAGVRHELDGVLNSRFEHRVICLEWHDAIRIRTEGTLDPAFVARAMAEEGHRRTWETLVVQALTWVLTSRVRRRRGTVAIRYDDVVAPELRRGDDAVLRRRIYRTG